MEQKTLQKTRYVHALSNLIEKLLHALVRQLHTKERGSVGRHCASKSRSESREEGLEATATIDRTDGTTDGGLTRRTLQTRLDSINREDRDPHSNTGGTTSSHNSRQGQLAGNIAIGILRGQRPLDVLISSEVSSRARTITRQSHSATTEN